VAETELASEKNQRNMEIRMTTALALIELPADKEHTKIVDVEPFINEKMIAEFVAYLDASSSSTF